MQTSLWQDDLNGKIFIHLLKTKQIYIWDTLMASFTFGKVRKKNSKNSLIKSVKSILPLNFIKNIQNRK